MHDEQAEHAARRSVDEPAEAVNPEGPEPITIREAIRVYRGDFYKSLLRAHESGSILHLCLAYKRADADHRQAFWQFPCIGSAPGARTVADIVISDWPEDIARGLEITFPGLKALDELTDNPTDFDLHDEQPRTKEE